MFTLRALRAVMQGRGEGGGDSSMPSYGGVLANKQKPLHAYSTAIIIPHVTVGEIKHFVSKSWIFSSLPCTETVCSKKRPKLKLKCTVLKRML